MEQSNPFYQCYHFDLLIEAAYWTNEKNNNIEED